MRKLMLLYWGTFLLMLLSHRYYPVEHYEDGNRLSKKHFMWQTSDIFVVLTITWMTCFSFLRTRYNDTFTYIIYFRNAPSLEVFFAEGRHLDLTGNPLSYLYEAFMHELTDNIHIYFFFPAVLSSFSVVKLCKRFSVNPAFSLLIFYSIGT